MTARFIIPPSLLREAAQEAKTNGVVVTITMPDGAVCKIEPMQPGKADPFDMVDLRK